MATSALLLGQQQQQPLDYSRVQLSHQQVFLAGQSHPQGPMCPGADTGVVTVAVGAVQPTIGMMAAVHPTTQITPPPLLHGVGHHPKLGPGLMRRQPVVIPPWGVGEPGGFSTRLEHVHEGDETEEEKLETPPNSPSNGQMDVS